ncbi:MAG: VWA domain-containing protein [Spirochaetota bacterium]
MIIKKRTILTLVLAIAVVATAGAQRLSIGQVDTGRLLVGQRVDLYLSLDLPGDAEPDLARLRVFESADGETFEASPRIIDVVPVSSIDAPLSFYMLVDNSGSMYDERIESRPELRRIDAARSAIREFANSITSARDQIGLAVFNTRYRRLAAPSTDKAQIGALLDSIEEPAREEGYTELYAALIQAAADASATGRRTVVVLSDGENYPYSVYENEDHPVYGSTLFRHDEAIDAFQREGLSLFAIHYGGTEDPNLDEIVNATGGRVYRATDANDLARVYEDIRDVLLAEYLLSYEATMIPAERRVVRVTYAEGSTDLVAERPYFANTLFAGDGDVGLPLLLALLVLGLVGLAVLLTISIRGGSRGTSLVVLDRGDARKLEKTIALGDAVTVIGASPDADVTIAGSPAVSERHAVVSYEPSKSEYTIVSDAPVRVNNQPVTKRTLKPGDVINIEGTIFAFDEPDEPADSKGSAGSEGR